jgi:metallo-beta-lactamase class B
MSHPPPTKFTRRTAIAGIGALAAAALNRRLYADPNPDWTAAIPPFRIAGNLYYVGSRDLASYLIATSVGHILINSNLGSSPPQIKSSIEQLGFKYHDIQFLLISHAHFDHCAGSAQIVHETKAWYLVLEPDVPVVESGGKSDFHYGSNAAFYFPPAKVRDVIHDGTQVKLGYSQLTGHKTAGHTKGCTTWTLTVHDEPEVHIQVDGKPGQKPSGKNLNVVIVGGPNVNPGYRLVNNPTYPEIAEDYAQTFRTLKSLPCDIFLGAHGLYFDMLAKLDRLKSAGSNPASNPFIDPDGYQAFVADRQQVFETELASQKSGHAPS